MASDGVTASAHDSEGYSWSMAFGSPHPGLAGVVAGPYCGYTEHAEHAFRRREVATGRVTLIISFGQPLDVVEMPGSASDGRRLTSFVAGLHDGYAITEHHGQHGLEV